MKNSLSDLNNYLFEELERLNDDEELSKEEGALEREIKRAKTITDVGQAIIENAKVMLDAQKLLNTAGYEINANEVQGICQK